MASLRAAEADQLLVEANGSTQTLILNRPKQLNVLSSTMIKGLLRCFIAYEKQDGVKLLIMKGKGRVFCARGDVTTCLRSIHNEGWKWGVDFFRNMYSLDYIIATYTKPQVSLLTGIVMGGGAGVSLHGRFRVATDETVFAMPETALGLFPGVGASYFLSRLPGFYGEYVALAGARLDGVKLLIMKGNGRAFCAGGDVTACFRSIHNEGWKWGADFFRNQYSLDYIIATYTKPQVSLLTGIVMGGGAGLSLHGRFRVATDKTVFAMPETALGLFPDVGASYFLSRLPGFYGEYVALAGARLDGAEMLACGLATHFVRSNRMLVLEESLKKLDTTNTSAVCGIINQFSEKPSLKENSSLNRMKIINKCFSKRTVEEIISALEQVASDMADEWMVVTIQSLKKASPTSLKISLKLIREGRTQTIGECFRREYRVVCHVVQGDFSKDFYEGSRSILINKDRNPRWMPPRLKQVDDEAVEQYFCRMDDPRCEDLNLPSRCYNGINIESKL